jgi:DNA invertase Pin-like site-specific DNA recombinase
MDILECLKRGFSAADTAKMCNVSKMTVYRTSRANSIEITGTRETKLIKRKQYKRSVDPELIQVALSTKKSMHQICTEMEISKATLYNYIKEFQLITSESPLDSVFSGVQSMVIITGAGIGVDAGIPVRDILVYSVYLKFKYRIFGG